MKKFLSNPVVAMLIAVVVVIASVLINTKVRFGPICENVREGFDLGIGSEAAIASELKTLCNAAERLTILAGQNDTAADEAGELESCIEEMRLQLANEDRPLHALYTCYETILRDCFALESALARLPLSEADTESLSAAQHDAASAKAAIDDSSYNDSVYSFQKRYHHFPTVQLAGLAGVSMPELFA